MLLAFLVCAAQVRAQDADILDAYLDRTYYTTETEARVLASVALPKEEVQARGLRVSAEEELGGLDIGEHGMEAYGGFQIFTTT